jgi:hypothetical protein
MYRVKQAVKDDQTNNPNDIWVVSRSRNSASHDNIFMNLDL